MLSQPEVLLRFLRSQKAPIPESVRRALVRLTPVDFGLENQPISEEELGELRDALTFLHEQKRAASALTHCDARAVRLAQCRDDDPFPRSHAGASGNSPRRAG